MKKQRNNGIDDLCNCVDDILDIENLAKQLPLLYRLHFKRNYKKNFKTLNDNWYFLLLENQLEVINCAYEKTLNYKRKGSLTEYLK